MRIKINGKIFTADTEDSGVFHKVRIKEGIDDFDILFFKEWMQAETPYREDIPFISKISQGKLTGCFPCELGEDYVLLVHNGLKEI